MFQEGKLNAGDKKAIKELSEKYVASDKFAADYIEQITDTEMRKDKRPTDNDRKSAQRKQLEYNDIDWEDLYYRNQLSSLNEGELELYMNHHNIAFKGKKDEKVRVVKVHIGSKILTSVVQDSPNNIQSASDPNSSSNSDSDRVERIVGSSSNSSELNDSGDPAADGEQEQEAEETILETSTSRYGRQRTRVLRDNYVPWHNMHVEM